MYGTALYMLRVYVPAKTPSAKGQCLIKLPINIFGDRSQLEGFKLYIDSQQHSSERFISI